VVNVKGASAEALFYSMLAQHMLNTLSSEKTGCFKPDMPEAVEGFAL